MSGRCLIRVLAAAPPTARTGGARKPLRLPQRRHEAVRRAAAATPAGASPTAASKATTTALRTRTALTAVAPRRLRQQYCTQGRRVPPGDRLLRHQRVRKVAWQYLGRGPHSGLHQEGQPIGDPIGHTRPARAPRVQSQCSTSAPRWGQAAPGALGASPIRICSWYRARDGRYRHR